MSPYYPISEQELRAVRYAYDELRSYYETVGEESSLDDEEMPSYVTRDALRVLQEMLVRLGETDLHVREYA